MPTRKSSTTVKILLALKEKYGDLNKALVIEYVLAHGMASERSIAQDLGVSRDVVKRALQDWPDSGHRLD